MGLECDFGILRNSPPLGVNVARDTHHVVREERCGPIRHTNRIEQVAERLGRYEALGGGEFRVRGEHQREQRLHPGLDGDLHVPLAHGTNRANQIQTAGRIELRGVHLRGNLEHDRDGKRGGVATIRDLNEIEQLVDKTDREHLLVIGEIERLVEQANDRVDPMMPLGYHPERDDVHAPSIATNRQARASWGEARTVEPMRNRLAASIVVGVGILLGVGLAVFTLRGTDTTPGDAPENTVAVEIDQSGTGKDCIGGICATNLPATISYEEIGAYLAVLRDALATNPTPDTANACHVVAHEIGRRADPARGVAALLELDDGRCLYGYQHGVLEGWSLRSSIDELAAGIPAACRAYEDGSTSGGLGTNEIEYARGSCAHGVGHAIALQSVGSVREAVLYCAGVGEGQIGGCAGGVYMAYALENPSQGGNAGTLTLALEEVTALCPSLEGEYQTECWSKLWLLGERVGIDARGVAKLCPPAHDSCGRGVGEGLYYEYTMEASDAMEACPSNVQPACYYGIAWAEANAWAGSGGVAATYQSVCGRFTGETGATCRRSEEESLRGSVQ